MLIGKNGALAGHYQIRRGEFADMKGKRAFIFVSKYDKVRNYEMLGRVFSQ